MPGILDSYQRNAGICPLARKLARYERGSCAPVFRLVNKIVRVEPFAHESNEQIAGTHTATVGTHTRKAEVWPRVIPLDCRRRLPYAHHESVFILIARLLHRGPAMPAG